MTDVPKLETGSSESMNKIFKLYINGYRVMLLNRNMQKNFQIFQKFWSVLKLISCISLSHFFAHRTLRLLSLFFEAIMPHPSFFHLFQNNSLFFD